MAQKDGPGPWCRVPQGQTSQRPLGAPLSIQEADAVREALVPSLACAAAHAGDLEVLQALVDLVRPRPSSGTSPSHTSPRAGGGAGDGLALGPCSARLCCWGTL